MKTDLLIEKYLKDDDEINNGVISEGFFGTMVDIVKASNHIKNGVASLNKKYSKEEIVNAKEEFFDIITGALKKIKDKDQRENFLDGLSGTFAKELKMDVKEIKRQILSKM